MTCLEVAWHRPPERSSLPVALVPTQGSRPWTLLSSTATSPLQRTRAAPASIAACCRSAPLRGRRRADTARSRRSSLRQPAADEPADCCGSRERGQQPADLARNTAANSTRITGITSKGCRGATDWV